MAEWARLDDVFGVSRELPGNYIVRDSVDQALVDALARDQHIVIYGSSKQGKTCLRKYNLRTEDYVLVTCGNRWTLAQLHSAILKAAGYVVEGSTTRTVSGEAKVTAKLGGGLNFFGNKATAEASTDVGGTKKTDVVTTPMELDPADVNDIIAALENAQCPQFVVLEDFHYLPEETQRDFAVALKAFHEDSHYCFVIVGVWRDQNRLVQHNGDLTGRLVAIDADQWTREELREVVEFGESLLNITFTEGFKNELLDGCFSNVYVVQESCRLACERAGVIGTQQTNRVVDANASSLIKEAVDAHSARYTGFIINFALGFQTSTLEMFKWLLWPVLTADVTELERGLKYGHLRAVLDERHPAAPINAGNITQALQSVASLQVGKMAIKPVILDYDETNRRLSVVDRSFLIWLQHQDRPELLALAELPTEQAD
ncbi:ATP-binding protein [Mycobacterium camsae]|uniref:ATP-binding protein n=1 Tax=Mycobacterium gordonae TaxID=1778 RepID=UPI0019826DFF|nr:ATP-binding protein [Mycobacterium gordonae]